MKELKGWATRQVTDREQLLPMIESVRASMKATPETVLADAGYWDTSSLRQLSGQGLQVLMSPDGQVKSETARDQTVERKVEEG
jgi:hypothetical protein